MKKLVALVLIPALTGCGLLGGDREAYYQAMQAREDRIASRQAAAELRLQQAQQAHEEQMARIVTQAGGITDPSVRGIVLVSVTGSIGMAHIATTALAMNGKTEERAQPIAPPETTAETLKGFAAVLAPIVPWLGHAYVMREMVAGGMGNSFSSGGDMTISGSLNDYRPNAWGDGAITIGADVDTSYSKPTTTTTTTTTTNTTTGTDSWNTSTATGVTP